jgi:hypothetical protein
MPITLTLQIVGEIWHNRENLEQQLAGLTPGSDVIIDVNSEGPALEPYGVFELLSKYPNNYTFTKWSNPIEHSLYPRVKCSETSHFFRLSWRYWIDEIENKLTKHTFGFFIGRSSISRNCIFYDTAHNWPDQFLLSKMKTTVKDIWGENYPTDCVILDKFSDWADTNQQQLIKQWWADNPVSSLDNLHVHDYYRTPETSTANCALSLLSYYDQFNIELICETYTHGTTFFPTEKTVRPIVGNKPFIIYGPKDFLKNMRQLGFETFSPWWDESYDDLDGSERWKAMKNVITTICQWDDDKKQQVLHQCSQVTQHNRKRLRELINDYKEF